MSLRRIAGRAQRAADRVDKLPRAQRRLAALEELARLRKALNDEVRAETLALRADKVPVQVIADHTGVSRQALHRWLAAQDARQRATEGGTDDGAR